MDLLENALVQGYSDKFPEEPIQRIKPGKIPGVAVSPKGKPAPKSSPEGTQPSNVKTVNKRKMKNTSNNIVKKIKAAGRLCYRHGDYIVYFGNLFLSLPLRPVKPSPTFKF